MPFFSKPGKPFIYLLDDPEREKQHGRCFTKRPEAHPQYDLLIDALFRIVTAQALSAEDLAILTLSMKSSYKVVYEEAGRRLMQLSHYFPAAADALMALLDDPKAKIRVRVIQSIWSDRPPEDVMRKIIDRGMQDVSAEVRLFAQERATKYLK